MVGSLITRAVIMAVGYVYPAYKCFKCVEMNRSDVEQLRFWCQYWMIIAIVTVLERLGDAFVSWLPLYSEAKLAFIVYLWHPRTMGTMYVYSTFLRPLVANHEGDIDRNLNEMATRVGDLVSHYWQRGSIYAQSRAMELFQYVASQAPSSRPEQGSDVSQIRPPPPPPGFQQPPSVYQPPPTTEYRPSAPVLLTEYHSQGGGGYHYQARPPQQGYSQQIPGYPEPPYHRQEEEASYETMNVVEPQPLSQPIVSVLPDSTSGYMTRRQRSRQQGGGGIQPL